MSYLVAIIVPPLSALFCGRLILAVVLAILQLTVIGWLPASLVACFVVAETRRRDEVYRQQKYAYQLASWAHRNASR